MGLRSFIMSIRRKEKELAQIVQKRFDTVLGDENKRKAKGNSSYYLLTHSKAGFGDCGSRISFQIHGKRSVWRRKNIRIR